MGDSGPEPTLGPGEWLVGLQTWVIEDGNYDSFSVGEERHFALEFTANGLAAASGASRRAERVGDGYEIEAVVVLANRRLAVIDFGLSAYSDAVPPGLTAGSFVHGHTRLFVDPYLYFEWLGSRREVPPLIYSWTVTGLWWQTAPFVVTNRGLEQDDAQRSWAPIDHTWEAPARGREFLLRCRLGDAEPTRPAQVVREPGYGLPK